jgi:tetratricopeptide (TPR) repeat protein
MTVDTTVGDGPGPYVGLRPFRQADSPWFFGRDREAAEVAERWRANRVMVLHGTSGVGKTSLLQAGILPELDDGRADILPVGRPSLISAFPIAALPDHNPHTLALLSAWSPDEPATGLSGMSVRDFLANRPPQTDSYGAPWPTYAVIDQAEKLFLDMTSPDSARRAFIDELAEALDDQPSLRLLLAIREDSLDDLRRYEAELGGMATYAVRSLTVGEGARAIQRPAERAGYSLSPALIDELLSTILDRDIRGSRQDESGYATITSQDVEPALLQAVCAGFWTALPRPLPPIIDLSDLRRAGGGTGLLARFCTQAITAVAEEYDQPAADLGSWLQRTFVTENGTPHAVPGEAAETTAQPNAAETTAPPNAAGTSGQPNGVVRALSNRHVLKASRQAGLRWYELQHSCLVQPLLRAVDQARHAVSRPPQVSAADLLWVAEAAMADGDLELAARQAEAAVRATDDDLRLRAEAESVLGNVEHARQNLGQAEARYRHAAALFEALQDTSAVARLLAAIGQVLLAQGQVTEAVDKLYAAIRRIPNDLTVQTELGRALWLQGQHAAAVAVLTAVLTIDGQARNALRARGEVLADLGEAEKALRDLDRVRRPRWPTARAARALALATLRRRSAADEEIGAALSDAPDNGQVLLYAARVGELSGNRVRAADLARQAEAAASPALLPHQLEQARRLQRLGETTLNNAR